MTIWAGGRKPRALRSPWQIKAASVNLHRPACDRLAAERLGLATAAGEVPIVIPARRVRGTWRSAGRDFLCRLIIGQPLVREGDSSRRLSVHMGQRQAVGIDHTIAARDRLESPGSREAARRHASRISCTAAGGPSRLVRGSAPSAAPLGILNGLSRLDMN